jgi:hypothetical protein
MRSLGVTQVGDYRVWLVGDVDVSALSDDLATEVKDRMHGSKCGAMPTESRPDWLQYRARGKMEFKRTEKAENRSRARAPYLKDRSS